MPSTAFCCLTCLLDSGSNRYLRQTVESICAFCLVHGQRVKPIETRIDAHSLLKFATFVTESMTITLELPANGVMKQIVQHLINPLPLKMLPGLAGECGRSALQAMGWGVTYRSTRTDIAAHVDTKQSFQNLICRGA